MFSCFPVRRFPSAVVKAARNAFQLKCMRLWQHMQAIENGFLLIFVYLTEITRTIPEQSGAKQAFYHTNRNKCNFSFTFSLHTERRMGSATEICSHSSDDYRLEKFGFCFEANSAFDVTLGIEMKIDP